MKTMNNNLTVYSNYTIHEFHPDLIDRPQLALNNLMKYDGELVLITEVHQPCWGKLMYTVTPLSSPCKEIHVYHHELWQGKKINLVQRNNYEILNSDIFKYNENELREEYIEAHDEEPENEDEIQHYTEFLVNREWCEVMSAIKSYEHIHGRSDYLVIADFGLWNGHFDGGQIFTGMRDVLQNCLKDMWDYKVYFEKGQLIIKGYHHDGTNTYVVRELKDGSADYIARYEWDLEPRELHRRLFNSSRWTMRVKMFDILYYWDRFGGVVR